MDQKAIGEFSNSYSVFVPALQRVARDLEDVRLTFTLRNPIERCYISWAGAHIRERYGFDLLCAENQAGVSRRYITPPGADRKGPEPPDVTAPCRRHAVKLARNPTTACLSSPRPGWRA